MQFDSVRLSGALRSKLSSALRPVLAGALLAFASPLAQAQAYPSRPVTLVVPFAPGGGVDALGRAYAQRMSAAMGQSFVVENRAGAGSTIGAASVAAAAPDGYTLLVASNSTLSVSPHVYKSLPYHPEKSFAPVSLTGMAVFGFVVNPALPVTTPKELVDYARAHPGEINFGSSGIGTGPHLLGEAFRSSMGIQATHVPYKGGGPAHADLIAGRLHYMLDSITALLPQIRAGKVRAIGVLSRQRMAALPDVPTLSELGLMQSEGGLWIGIFAPAATPPAIVQRLSAETRKMLAARETMDALSVMGLEAAGSTPEELAAFLRDDIVKWGRVVKAAGIKAE